MIHQALRPLPQEALRDNLTVPQFFLDHDHPARGYRGTGTPWLIDDITGRSYGLEEIRTRTSMLASALAGVYGLGQGDVLCIFSPNHIDYPILIWAAHRVGAAVTCANPMLSASELAHQLKITKASLIVTQESFLEVARQTIKLVGLSQGRVALLVPTAESFHPDAAEANNGDTISTTKQALSPNSGSPATVDQLILQGSADLASKGHLNFTEQKLANGEAKTKVAFLSLSSGTTGPPKAIAISHYSITINSIQTTIHHRVSDTSIPFAKRAFRDGDVMLGVLPIFHIAGLITVLHCHILMGIPIVLMSKFTLRGMLSCMQKYRVSHLALVPPMIMLLTTQPEVKEYDLSSVRTVFGGAAPITPDLEKAFRATFPTATIGQGYGMTEVATAISMCDFYCADPTISSTGFLIPGTEVKILKADGSLAGYDESGECCVRGPQTAIGYLDNDQATKETFQDGWVHTGDEVRINRAGEVFVVDRIKELIKVRAYQVAPAELEGHLVTHPAIVSAGVIGIPDTYSGEVPLAFVVLKPDAANAIKGNPAAADNLKQVISKYVSDHKIKYKWLAGGVEFIDELPVSPSGKILRRILRDKVKSRRGTTRAKL